MAKADANKGKALSEWMDTYGIVHPKKRSFLVAFSECGVIFEACRCARMGRQTHYDWMEVDEQYAKAFKMAEEAAVEALEFEARRRAKDGVTREVFHQGEVCGYRTDFSDLLMIFLLKGARPEKYREQGVQVQVNVNIADRIKAARVRVRDAQPKELPNE